MDTRPIKVLIVDDEEDLAEIASESLEMAGFQSSFKLNGEDALQELQASKDFDVIISDSHMPGMSGEDLLNQVIGLNLANDPLFYLCTGDIDVEEKDIKMKGATGLVNKPYALDKLVDRIKEDFKNK